MIKTEGCWWLFFLVKGCLGYFVKTRGMSMQFSLILMTNDAIWLSKRIQSPNRYYFFGLCYDRKVISRWNTSIRSLYNLSMWLSPHFPLLYLETRTIVSEKEIRKNDCKSRTLETTKYSTITFVAWQEMQVINNVL